MLVSKSESHFTGSESWSALLSYFYIFHTPRLCRLWAFSMLTISWCIPIESLTQTGWLCYRTLLRAEIEAKLSINNCMYHSLRQRWNHRLDSWYDLIIAVTIEWSDDKWLHGEISAGRRTAHQWFYRPLLTQCYYHSLLLWRTTKPLVLNCIQTRTSHKNNTVK